MMTFPFISSIIYIPSLGVKVQSDAHYSSNKISWSITEGYHPSSRLVILLVSAGPTLMIFLSMSNEVFFGSTVNGDNQS